MVALVSFERLLDSGIACCCLLSRSQHDQKHADDAKRNSGDQQLGAFGWKLDGHDSHDSGVRKTRPRSKSNHAAMRGRVACCQQQENPERRIKTKGLSDNN